jgi:hypothetical protein
MAYPMQDLDLPSSEDEDLVEMLIEQQHAEFKTKQQERVEQLRPTRIWSAAPSPSPAAQRQRSQEQHVLVKQVSGMEHNLDTASHL